MWFNVFRDDELVILFGHRQVPSLDDAKARVAFDAGLQVAKMSPAELMSREFPSFYRDSMWPYTELKCMDKENRSWWTITIFGMTYHIKPV